MKDKIKQLNKAWKLMNEGISIISDIFKEEKYWGIRVFIKAMKKDNNRVQKMIYRQIQADYINEEFNKMAKRLKKEETK